ncbi:putative reverse transcriptase domain-containing protein, partial [Tanacetum coccineum]
MIYVDLTSMESYIDETLNDATPCIHVAKKVVSPYVVDDTREKEKLSPMVTTIESYPPLPTQVLVTRLPDYSPFNLALWMGWMLCLRMARVWVKLHGVPITAFNEDGLSVIATKLGTPLMLDSYIADMCMQSWGRSSYARAMIELRANVELKDNIVAAMPKITREGYYTCNIRNIGAGATKNLKNTSQTPKGIPVGQKMGFKPKHVFQPVSKTSTANLVEKRRILQSLLN